LLPKTRTTAIPLNSGTFGVEVALDGVDAVGLAFEAVPDETGTTVTVPGSLLLATKTSPVPESKPIPAVLVPTSSLFVTVLALSEITAPLFRIISPLVES
jgi:hypothetical protein